jgi:hypothetical protein
MKFCWHCWHSIRDTYRAYMKKPHCKKLDYIVDYFEWEEECCICGKIKTRQSIYNYLMKDLNEIPKVYATSHKHN